MADLSQFAALASSLVQAHTFFDKSRCMALRNRFSRCKACVDACPVGAITLEPRSLTVDKNVCVNCGSCSTVCPTQALMPLEPSDDELAMACAQAIEPAGGMACFACARVMSKRGPDPSKVIPVECLSRVDESLILRLAAHGVETIVLADGNCDSCKYKACGHLSHQLVDEANQLIEAMGNPTLVISTTGVPEELCMDFSQEALSNERRSLFFHTKDAVKETARNAAVIGVKGATGIDLTAKAVQALAEEPHRHNDIVNALAELGEPQNQVVSSRHLASVRINEEKCSTCKKCVLICPGKALAESAVPRDDSDGIFFEFDAWKCLRCNLCLHVCHDAAITLEDANMLEIFEMEPRLIPVPAAPKYSNRNNFFKSSF